MIANLTRPEKREPHLPRSGLWECLWSFFLFGPQGTTSSFGTVRKIGNCGIEIVSVSSVAP